MKPCDVLVLGSGIAGLSFAISLASRRPDLSVRICSKTGQTACNTWYAQGGIAAVTDRDRDAFEDHIRDTIQAGGGYCNEQVVRAVVEDAPGCIASLSQWGVPFDRTPAGAWDTGLEGGHSYPRILHCADRTGAYIIRSLLHYAKRLDNITFHSGFFATDLIIRDRQCFGVYYLDERSGIPKSCPAKITYLATGGSGQLFRVTTNPAIATGDGVAMAHRAGARVEHMGFYQFHPTAFSGAKSNPAFLISEAVRGFGAHVINRQEKRFLFEYDPRGELATRDIVSRAIWLECRKNHTAHVYLDCRHLNRKAFLHAFPAIAAHCRQAGYDLFKTPVPVMPAAHYQCGGIAIDLQGRTTIGNLYANGECACSGLHGANRLASNSLLEAVAIARRAAGNVLSGIDDLASPVIHQEKKPGISASAETGPDKIIYLRQQLQKVMYDAYVSGITGTVPAENTGTEQLSQETDKLLRHRAPSKSSYELRNLLTVARMIS
ncbi:L-aspartate oxidase [Sinomicrobium soli]|uniref:L-aspartate oxidase n=1 Tax=Sinomicrobium sp. N-1-3-6 TaxID=2219864 RepID=UPI00137534CD|nr:FAD-binding protein [Sinomicrobium sp. N-1-3-6]